MPARLPGSILAVGFTIFVMAFSGKAANPPIPPAKLDAPLATASGKQTAVFAGGCFWGTQAVFERVKGVLKTTAGYSGGSAETATYRQVITETTGHAESVEVIYDPAKITYGQLLRIYFSVAHDPTQLNRQGPDVGDQYRSAVFTHSPEQESAAIASRDREQSRHTRPIVTQIVPAPKFWAAEEYHQRYFEKNGGAACHVPSPR
jgi:peptide-methionine (S)-S-oxide reductase